MGRGVSSGGGQSSLGYLFGSGEAPKPASGEAPKPTTNTTDVLKKTASGEAPKPTTNTTDVLKNQGEVANTGASQKSTPVAPPPNVNKEIPAGVPANNVNNYFRADGQNSGNFLTDRPTTKVHAAPGGGSSLDYLFGGDGK